MNKNLFDRFLAGIAVVHVKTQDEYNQFMQLLEKETKLKLAWGEKPTDSFKWIIEKEKTCIRRVVSSDMISFGDISYYDSNGYEIIEFSDLMKKENNMKFKVGDKVRVRSWESMETEFGLDDSGNIYLGCALLFFKRMKSLCGNLYTIDAIDDGWYTLKESSYYLIDEMLEPVKAETNGEHFRNELRELKGHVGAVVNGEPTKCDWDIRCYKCLFHGRHACIEEFKKWCAEPYEAQEDVKMEEPKPILDKVEHDYLAAVIAPKRIYKYVDYIVKRQVNEFYVIDVHIKHTTYSTKMMLSYYDKSEHMYDGMELDIPYTLKELGLEKE